MTKEILLIGGPRNQESIHIEYYIKECKLSIFSDHHMKNNPLDSSEIMVHTLEKRYLQTNLKIKDKEVFIYEDTLLKLIEDESNSESAKANKARILRDTPIDYKCFIAEEIDAYRDQSTK